jgi:hypothetical protein
MTFRMPMTAAMPVRNVPIAFMAVMMNFKFSIFIISLKKPPPARRPEGAFH